MIDFHDSHVHLTNYIQEGPPLKDFLGVMGERVGRAALFGIPLQQKWSYPISGPDAPTYYLQTDAPLYYYSFTDAHIAMTYRALPPEAQARFDPMITGFNPADMYAVDHIRRVLETFPGVFTGIGEFTIHKEFVTSKLGSEVPSLDDRALSRLLDFAGEVGLPALIHNDMDTPFSPEGAKPTFLEAMKLLLRRHPATTIIWAHVGLGRIIRPVQDHLLIIDEILDDPAFDHVYFDISWDEVAKYLDMNHDTVERAAALCSKRRDRFLFGTDEVTPRDPGRYFGVYEQYRPLWEALDPAVSHLVRIGNYERIFDTARRKVRAWEAKRGLI
ncbi:MAG TPA: amidohydrolase family protein [Polyangia bacterium]|nr:amidohydrolase family protein [Polyangia bacterium]